MRLGIAMVSRHLNVADPRPIVEQLVDLAQKIEELGLSGLWVTDSVGRGSATLDPLTVLAALCPVTRTIESGSALYSCHYGRRVELAHRVQTLNLLSGDGCALASGPFNSADFDALNVDDRPDSRSFQSTWRRCTIRQGEGVYGPPISIWPGTEAAHRYTSEPGEANGGSTWPRTTVRAG